jgi:DNA-directed RNA polymerase specialized sigma24 family protein
LVACLSERERWYVLEHYVGGRCYADIAREVGLSRERVRQIVGAAIGKIKKMMSEC